MFIWQVFPGKRLCVFCARRHFSLEVVPTAQTLHRFCFPSATFFRSSCLYWLSFPVLLFLSHVCFLLPCSGYHVSFCRACFAIAVVLTVISTYVEKREARQTHNQPFAGGVHTRYVCRCLICVNFNGCCYGVFHRHVFQLVSLLVCLCVACRLLFTGCLSEPE